MQHSNGETDIKNRLMDTEKGQERVRCMESNMKTYITICKVDSQQGFAVWLRKLKKGLCVKPEGLGGREMGGKFRRKGIYIYTPMADSC